MLQQLWERHHAWLVYIPWMLLLVVFLAGLLGDRGVYQRYHLAKETEKLEAIIVEKTAYNRKLRLEVQRLQNDPELLERLAREELGLVKPGEVVYQFHD